MSWSTESFMTRYAEEACSSHVGFPFLHKSAFRKTNKKEATKNDLSQTGVKISRNFKGHLGPPYWKIECPQCLFRVRFGFLLSFIHHLLKWFNISKAIWALAFNILRAHTKFWRQLVQGPSLFQPLLTSKLSTKIKNKGHNVLLLLFWSSRRWLNWYKS